jgi:hypothetical protein
MSQPTPYDREYNFTDYQTTNPTDPLPADHVDAELNRVVLTTDQILANLALIQRDDGALANGIVTLDSLDPEVITGISLATPWVTATAYAVGENVYESGNVYNCLIAHTSGTFATDLTAVKWVLLGAVGITSVFGRTGVVTATAGDYEADEVSFTPAGIIASTDVQSAIEEAVTNLTNLVSLRQPIDDDLTTIAGLTATTNNVIQSVASAWASRTPTQLLATILTGATNDDVIQRKAGVWTYRTMAQLATDLTLSGVASSATASFSAHKSAVDQSVVATTTAVQLTFGAELFDVGSYFATSAWTPPSGKCHISAGIELSGLTAGVSCNFSIFKNGSVYRRTVITAEAGGVASGTLSVVDTCNGTDVYTLCIESGSDGTYTISGGVPSTFFTGTMI